MKLLFDHNLSPKLVILLADLYPESSHVALLELDQADDVKVWEFALTHDFIIVTKDSDFNDYGAQRGFPPKLVWLRIGNCTTREAESLLRKSYDAISWLHQDQTLGMLTLL